jgi:hypothetical protein
MASEAQILANRLNAQKSTGPRTREGKAIVSQNAVKHGLTTRQDIISSEKQADFELYRDQMLDELDPIGPMESMLTERIVSLSWRLKRAGRIQNQAIDAMNADRTCGLLAKLTQSMFFKGVDLPQGGPSTSDGDLALGRLAIKDFSNARVLERLLMYERRMEHSLYKTILELQRLLVMRKLNPLRAGDQSRQGTNESDAACRVSRALTDEELVTAERAVAGTGYVAQLAGKL